MAATTTPLTPTRELVPVFGEGADGAHGDEVARGADGAPGVAAAQAPFPLPIVRRRYRVTGRVQGVGFRPFVYRAAVRDGVTGAVWNDPAGVVIEGQGSPIQLDEFLEALRSGPPAAAVVRGVVCEADGLKPVADEAAFEIRGSGDAVTGARSEVAVDTATCPACLADLRNPRDRRRHAYALVNCAECGPRYSIVRRVPYDRPNTTMAAFRMCETCRREYDDPADRRFHAQPTACHTCGPRVELVDAKGSPVCGGADAIRGAARRLLKGQVVAVKGIGGFHLAVRADDATAVERLRQLKHRPAKPFALMCASAAAAGRLVELGPEAAALLASPAAPIVLAPGIEGAPVAAAVAPGSHRLGVLLAYTPLHHLLFDELHGTGVNPVDTLIMTSGNDVDEPLVCDNAEAAARLGKLCDAILWHDRPIARAVDDSVVIVDAADSGGGADPPIFVRRARGYVPAPLPLPCGGGSAVPGLALGAEMKCTVAVVRASGGGGAEAILSQHLGDLVQARTYAAFKRAADDLCELFDVAPRWVAHDLHPGYLSTAHAKQLAARLGVPRVPVQHHHAHAAAVLAEHGWTDPALAVVCDGTGYGPDGTVWGGELLVVNLQGFRRMGRLRPFPLPGGDAAAKSPWRSAAGLLRMAFGEHFAETPAFRRLARGDAGHQREADLGFAGQMLRTGTHCVLTSSTGRLFDAVAALLGLCAENRYEAEAAMALESAAAVLPDEPSLPAGSFALRENNGLTEIDLTPWVRSLAGAAGRGALGGLAVSEWAGQFHELLAAAWEAAVVKAAERAGLLTVALCGGAMCNGRLSRRLARRLERLGFHVLRSAEVPPNDGGIAFGQAAVAAARAAKGMLKG